jgi:integrase
MAVRRLGKGWQTDFYAHTKRIRKVFPLKKEAEAYMGRIKASIREDRFLDLKREIFLSQLSDWYLSLEDVKRKISFERDRRSIQKLNNFFGSQPIRHLSASVIAEYQARRMGEMSYRKKPTRPATVNREISCLRTIFNKAILDGKLERNPTRGVKLLREKNERDRVLSSHEWMRYKAKCPRWYLPIAVAAYRTAMRKSEIVTLARSRVDLKGGFIRLRPEDTKTGAGRSIPIHPELVGVLKRAFKVRPLNCDRAFHRNGKPLGSNDLRWVHEVVCERAKIEDFTFHDFRHTCINNWRREGHDYFKIMAASGHKTMSVFKRYNMVDEEELKTLVKFAPSSFRN